MEESRLKIPVLLGFDVIHGYRTIFLDRLSQSPRNQGRPLTILRTPSKPLSRIEPSAETCPTSFQDLGQTCGESPLQTVPKVTSPGAVRHVIRAIDGTVVPSAVGGSLMFTSEISVAALRAMKDKYGDRIYGKFGFVDAFNPNTNWVDSDVIGVNAGIILLRAENLRTENVWGWVMQNTEISRAMKRISSLPYRKRPEMVGGHYRKGA